MVSYQKHCILHLGSFPRYYYATFAHKSVLWEILFCTHIVTVLMKMRTFFFFLNYLLNVVDIGWVLWHINLCRLFNAKSIFMQIFLFKKKFQFCMSTQFNCRKHFYLKLFSLIKQF